ncbi:MAG: hypothetical protein KBH99_00525 [Syntrophobacteraceae bacterium]|nr:hypothetical protein [Syntrophobacteraceae bacterium]
MDDMIQNEMEEVHLLDYVLILVKRMRFILIFTFTLSFLTAVYSLITPEIYQGTAKVVPPSKGSLGASAAILGQLAAMVPAGLGGGPASPSDLLVGMVTESRTIADAIIDRFNLMELYEAKTRMDAIKELSKVLKAQSDRKSGIVTIQVEDEDPKRAADMANAFVEELIKTERKLSTTEAAQKRLFYERQLKETHADLVRAEEALQKFQETTGAIKIDNQAEAVFSGIANLRAQITAKEIQLKVMRTYTTPYNREVRQVEEELAGMKEQLKKLEAGADSSYGSTIIPTSEMPVLGVEYLRKLREFKIQEAIYEILLKQYETAKIDEANDAASSIQVLDWATVPDKRIKPKRTLMVVLATMVGFFLAVFAAFAAEYWEKASRDPEESERLARMREYLAPIKNSRVVVKSREILKKRLPWFRRD